MGKWGKFKSNRNCKGSVERDSWNLGYIIRKEGFRKLTLSGHTKDKRKAANHLFDKFNQIDGGVSTTNKRVLLKATEKQICREPWSSHPERT